MKIVNLRLMLMGIVLLLIGTNIQAQRIENVNAVLNQNETITIRYDLIGSDQNQRFRISIFSSHNNFSSPLNRVSGDVGNDIAPGTNRTILWQAKDELGNYSGNLTFEVRGSVIAATQTGPQPLTFTSPKVNDAFKIGKSMNILWQGGIPNNDVKLELFQNDIRLRNIGTSPNRGNYSYSVPTDLKGDGFAIKLFNLSDPNASVLSGSFKIRGKTPVYIKLIPVGVAAGVGVALLLGGKKKDCTDVCDPSCSNFNSADPSCATNLPDPPPPPQGG